VAAIAGCVHYWWLVKVGVRTPMKDTLVLTVLLLARIVWTMLKQRRKPAVVPAARTPVPTV
jgi:sulfoxide reductase heme-binding subunit YedZ